MAISTTAVEASAPECDQFRAGHQHGRRAAKSVEQGHQLRHGRHADLHRQHGADRESDHQAPTAMYQ